MFLFIIQVKDKNMLGRQSRSWLRRNLHEYFHFKAICARISTVPDIFGVFN